MSRANKKPHLPKGPTPSLIGSSLGRPQAASAGKRCDCSRCGGAIAMGERCYDVPQPSQPFSSRRRFCTACFRKVLEKTRRDIAEIESLCDGAKPGDA